MFYRDLAFPGLHKRMLQNTDGGLRAVHSRRAGPHQRGLTEPLGVGVRWRHDPRIHAEAGSLRGGNPARRKPCLTGHSRALTEPRHPRRAGSSLRRLRLPGGKDGGAGKTAPNADANNLGECEAASSGGRVVHVRWVVYTAVSRLLKDSTDDQYSTPGRVGGGPNIALRHCRSTNGVPLPGWRGSAVSAGAV